MSVGLENLYYAGSHGFDIVGPQHTNLQQEKAEDFLPLLDKAPIDDQILGIYLAVYLDITKIDTADFHTHIVVLLSEIVYRNLWL